MARISMLEYNNAQGEAKDLYDKQIIEHGRITNMKKTLLHSPTSMRIYMEWYTLRDELARFLDDKKINYYAYSISNANDCLICSTFFRRIITESGCDPDNLVLDEEEKILIEYGMLCLKDAHLISDELVSNLKNYYNEEQIVVLTAFAGMMIATNLINTALDVELDDYLIAYTKR